MEWSKKLTVFDNITFTIASILLIGSLFVKPEVAEYAVSMFGTFATVYVSVRLGYAAKSGVENYRKIANAMKNEESSYESDYCDNCESSYEEESENG